MLNGRELARRPRGKDHEGAFARENGGDGPADAPPRPGNEGDLAREPHRTRLPRDLISSMNSARVSGRRNPPEHGGGHGLRILLLDPA
jgi:hypothetical protein